MLSEQQLKELYESLSFEEKCGQLLQLACVSFDADGEVTGLPPDRTFTKEEICHVGSALGVYNGDDVLRIQTEHMKHNKVPLIFMGDVIAGYAFSQPMPLAQACSFDTELVKKMAHSSAEVATAQGLNVTFSPMVDVSRDARWGRVAESFGEDVCLGSAMAKAMVEGYQGEESDALDSMSSCVKHFAAYGYGEAGRDYNNVELSRRTLLSTFLPNYKAAVDAGCDMVMTSFNTIGGIPVAIDKELLRGVLREDWGFDGTIISDFGAQGQCYIHRALNEHKDVAKYSLEAGVDIAMVDRHYPDYIPSLLESGELSWELFEECVMNVLRLKNKKGLLEDPFRYIKGTTRVDMDKHYQIALEGVEKSCVLLENDGILPLKQPGKVALIGPYAVKNRAVMMWNTRALPEAEAYRKLPIDIFSQVLGTGVTAEPGCAILPAEHFLVGDERQTNPCYQDPKRYLEQAVKAAKEADTVILMLGEHQDQSGESASQASIALPDMQMELLRRVCQVNPNVVTVIFCGRPIDLREIKENSKAILMAWMSGDACMEGVANLLAGKAVPSGKLSMCIPYHSGQCPIHYDMYPTGRPCPSQEKAYTTRYLDVPNAPLYPFGYGLSYTTFAYSDITADGAEVTADKPLHLTVTVTNTGAYDGEEAVQLYLQDERAFMVSRPLREMKDFKKIALKAGESKQVTFTVTEEMLRFFDRDCKLISEAGKHIAYIGGDSTTMNAYEFMMSK